MNSCRLLMAMFMFCAVASAQTFQFRVQQGTNLAPVAEGGIASIQSDGVGRLAQATVTAIYNGVLGASVSDVRIAGAPEFVLSGVPALPRTLTTGQSFSFEIRFLPAATARLLAQMIVQYTEGTTSRVATLNLSGGVADLTIGYILPADNNFVPVSTGGRLLFPATGINSTTPASIVILNRGSGAGTVSALAVSGAAFQLQGIPFLPSSIEAGGSLRFTVAFLPRQPGLSTGSLSITAGDRATLVNLEGSTASADFSVSYFLQSDSNTFTLQNGGRISFPFVSVNSTATATIVISNRAGGGGHINSVSLSGNGFQLSGTPPTPLFVGVGSEVRFGIVFAPKQAGLATGFLQIAFADRVVVVNLDGNTATPDFSISYILTNGNAISVQTGGRISFPAAALNSSATATIVVTNRGASGNVNSLSVSGIGFQISGAPALPVLVDAGRELRFSLTYSPRQAGFSNGILQIGFPDRIVVINLEGSTTAPEFVISYVFPSDGNVVPLPPGNQITFPATSVFASSIATIVVSNRGTGSGSINSIALTGGSFQLASTPLLPSPVDAGRDLRFAVVFTPSKAGNESGALTLTFPERVVSIQLFGTTAAPEFKVSYFIQNEGNAVFIEAGDKIAFPATRVNASAAAVVAISNLTGGAGYINSIRLTGEGFQLAGVAALPVLVTPGRELRFGIAYNPTRLETYSGLLTVVFDERTITISITGTSTGPKFTYATFLDGTETPYFPRDTIPVPETSLRETTSLTIQVKNGGNADGVIPGIVVSGQGYQLSNLPIFPAVLAPSATVQFTLTFTPVLPGQSNGRLQIGADAFDLVATANGPRLLYSYVGSGGTVTIQDTRTVLWGRVEAGQRSEILFIVRNDGTSPAVISSAAIVDSRSAFRIVNPPGFPATVAPKGQLSLSLSFSPTALGDNSARLRVDSELFNLVGSGTPAPALPAFELRGLTQSLDPLQQPAVSLVLAAPYPHPLSGTLVLTVNSRGFEVDPAVQFATGGRSVAFTVPANTTRAQFPGGSSEIRLQTGTIAGTLSIATTFALESGIDVTPDSLPARNHEVPEAPPRVLDFQIDARTTNGFTLVLTGLSTTRALRQLDLNITASAGYNVPNGSFSLNIESAAATWYRSADSRAFGSLFSARIPFTLQGLDSSQSLSQAVQSISATLTNEKGQSNSISVKP